MAILNKYGQKCTNCGAKSELCVHHIERMNPKDHGYEQMENLTLLCRPCHMSFHRKAGHIMPPANSGGRRGNNPPVKCMYDNCDKYQHGKGLCKKHYARENRKKQGW